MQHFLLFFFLVNTNYDASRGRGGERCVTCDVDSGWRWKWSLYTILFLSVLFEIKNTNPKCLNVKHVHCLSFVIPVLHSGNVFRGADGYSIRCFFVFTILCCFFFFFCGTWHNVSVVLRGMSNRLWAFDDKLYLYAVRILLNPFGFGVEEDVEWSTFKMFIGALLILSSFFSFNLWTICW